MFWLFLFGLVFVIAGMIIVIKHKNKKIYEHDIYAFLSKISQKTPTSKRSVGRGWMRLLKKNIRDW